MPGWGAVPGGAWGKLLGGASALQSPSSEEQAVPRCPVLPHSPSGTRAAPPAPQRGHRAGHRAPCSRPGNPSRWEKASLRNRPRAEGQRTCPSRAAGTAQSQRLFWCCQEAARCLPGRPPELCEECPRARVAARQALPRHIPMSGLPAAPGTPGPAPGNGVGAAPTPHAAPAERPGASQHLGVPHGMGNWGPGGPETPKPPPAEPGGRSTLRRGRAGQLPSVEGGQAACSSPAQHPPPDPRPPSLQERPRLRRFPEGPRAPAPLFGGLFPPAQAASVLQPAAEPRVREALPAPRVSWNKPNLSAVVTRQPAGKSLPKVSQTSCLPQKS